MRRVSRSVWLWLLTSAALVAVAGSRLDARLPWRYPLPNEITRSEHMGEDLGWLSLGSHRMAADMAYIQLLQYYGKPEEHEGHEDGDDHASHKVEVSPGVYIHDAAAGIYPLLKEKALRVLYLDPFFNGAIIELGGALAFNQKRTDEALDYLRQAIRLDPSFYRYHLYVSAILYKQKGDDKGLLDMLLKTAKTADCPPMVQGLLGNLLKKYGRVHEAAAVYYRMYATSPRVEDRRDAEGRLAELLRERPEAIQGLPGPFPL